MSNLYLWKSWFSWSSLPWSILWLRSMLARNLCCVVLFLLVSARVMVDVIFVKSSQFRSCNQFFCRIQVWCCGLLKNFPSVKLLISTTFFVDEVNFAAMDILYCCDPSLVSRSFEQLLSTCRSHGYHDLLCSRDHFCCRGKVWWCYLSSIHKFIVVVLFAVNLVATISFVVVTKLVP